MQSVVLLTQQHEIGNRLLEKLGWGPNNFSVTLANNYRGLHTWVEQDFIDLILSETSPEGFPQADYDILKSNLIISYRTDSNNHFSEVLAIITYK